MEQKPNNAVQTLASHYLNTTLHRVDNKAMVFTSGEIRIGPHLENSNGIFINNPFVSPRTWSRKQYYCWFTGGTLGHQWQSKVVQHRRGIRPQLATWRKDSYPGMRYSPRYLMIMIFDDICISWTSMFYPLLLPSTKMLVMRKLLKIPSMDGTDGQNWYPQSGTGDVGQQVVCSSCSGSLHVVMDNGLVAQTSLRMISA